MLELKYRTRAESTPNGKPKVYFSAHPKDLDAFFERTVAEILDFNNCAVYFDPESHAVRDEAELASALSDMQLFVFPVTSRFLFEENDARCKVFKYAKANNRVILPILEESGISDSCNIILGNVQLLDRNSLDSTAMSFSDKLGRFLDSVLISDSIAELVRAEFDAYIFMSYRKIDRLLAQKLMRTVHDNGFCRDVAIWYDEYIIPGEDYKRAIQNAIKGAAVFALTVTENLLLKNDKGEDNYVKAVEYPAACDPSHPIPILPVMMSETDRERLIADFPNIPELIDLTGGKTDALTAALSEKLGGLARRENDGDPLHNYYIGLAYLAGIDVEIDHPRAISLIIPSAEAGVAPAMEKLAFMYRHGEGVQRDHTKAVYWQRKYVEAKKTAFASEKSEATLRLLIDGFINLGGVLVELEKYSAALFVYEDALKYTSKYKKLSTAENSAVLYNLIGEVCEKRNNYRKALHCYRKAVRFGKKMIKTEHLNKTLVTAIAVSYHRLANLLCQYSEPKKAYKYCKENFGIIDKLKGQASDSEINALLASSYDSFAEVRLYDGANSYSVLDFLNKCCDLRRKLNEEFKSTETKKDLIDTLLKIGDIKLREKEFEDAAECYVEALRLSEEFNLEVKNDYSRRIYNISHKKLSDCLESQNQFADAMLFSYEEEEMKSFEQTVKTKIPFSSGRLSEEDGNLNSAPIYELLSEVHQAEEAGCKFALRKKYNDAKCAFEKGYKSAKELFALEAEDSYKMAYVAACISMGEVELELKSNEALKYFLEAKSLISEDAAKKGTIEERGKFVEILLGIAIVKSTEGDDKEALRLCKKIAKMLNGMRKESRDNMSKTAVAKGYIKLGMIYEKLKMETCCLDNLEQGTNLVRLIDDIKLNQEIKPLLRDAYKIIGKIFSMRGIFPLSYEYKKMSLDCATELGEKSSKIKDDYLKLAERYRTRSNLINIKPFDKKRCLEKEFAIYKTLVKNYPSDDICICCADVCAILAKNYLQELLPDIAKIYIEQGKKMILDFSCKDAALYPFDMVFSNSMIGIDLISLKIECDNMLERIKYNQ